MCQTRKYGKLDAKLEIHNESSSEDSFQVSGMKIENASACQVYTSTCAWIVGSWQPHLNKSGLL